MDLALIAADVAVSRSGASSLAEFAATRLPTVLIPYPTAADNHQFHNARAFVQSGAARMFEQSSVEPHTLASEILEIINNPQRRASMQQALERWDRPTSASEIADRILGCPTHIAMPPQTGEIRTVQPPQPATPKEQEPLHA
jgi:UDP-N-acetylglucosamine--N-acetylmuramyl-(pentapeptide) pyrophosphoryl-undecaprenol N-acetylglucosamine transferase